MLKNKKYVFCPKFGKHQKMWVSLLLLYAPATLPCDVTTATSDLRIAHVLADWCRAQRAHETIRAAKDMPFVSFVWHCIDNYNAGQCFLNSAETDPSVRAFLRYIKSMRLQHRALFASSPYRSRQTMHNINLRRLAAIAALDACRVYTCQIVQSKPTLPFIMNASSVWASTYCA